jgi:alkylation response protein AidB-like acyl-CoA dehydrogenase
MSQEMAEILLCTETPGGYGYLNDFFLGRIYCGVRGCEVYEGRMDIQ